MSDYDYTFRSMGSEVRLVIGPPLTRDKPPAADAAWSQHTFVEDFAAKLSRFRMGSELERMNADAAPAAPASVLLRAAVRAGLWAAVRTGGLVDPTLVEALERAGYEQSRDGVAPASLVEALAGAPARRPARPHPDRVWSRFEVDDAAAVVRRPPGVRFDTGGIGKGLAADAVAHRLSGYARFVVDCGGDIAVGGPGAAVWPFEIEIEHPLTGEIVHRVELTRGGVASSGLNVRIWRRPDGSFAHHLLDPSTGAPAWTGLIGATAVGGTALEAETLAKAALLSGPERGRTVLAEHGGVLFHDDGDVELVALPVRSRRSAA